MTIAQIADWFAPWQSLYESSKLVPAITQGVHLLALLIGGGLAVSADRATLRAYRAGPDRRGFQLAELGAVHRPVLIALGVMFASGLALATADVKTFAVAPLLHARHIYPTPLRTRIRGHRARSDRCRVSPYVAITGSAQTARAAAGRAARCLGTPRHRRHVPELSHIAHTQRV